MQPLPPTRPFFRNPTSCKPATAHARGKVVGANAITATETDTFTPTGCDAVPFDPGRVRDADGAGCPTRTRPGSPAATRSRSSTRTTRTRRSGSPTSRTPTSRCPRAWLSARPAAMASRPARFDQFGVNATTGKQEDNDPAEVPGGLADRHAQRDQPGARLPARRQGLLRPSVSGCPGRPTAAEPLEALPADRGRGPADQAGRRRDGLRERPGPQRVHEPARGAVHAPRREPARRRDARSSGTRRRAARTTARRTWSAGPARPTPARPSITTTGCAPIRGRSTPWSRRPAAFRRRPAPTRSRKIVISRPDGEQNIKSIKLSLPGRRGRQPRGGCRSARSPTRRPAPAPSRRGSARSATRSAPARAC